MDTDQKKPGPKPNVRSTQEEKEREQVAAVQTEALKKDVLKTLEIRLENLVIIFRKRIKLFRDYFKSKIVEKFLKRGRRRRGSQVLDEALKKPNDPASGDEKNSGSLKHKGNDTEFAREERSPFILPAYTRSRVTPDKKQPVEEPKPKRTWPNPFSLKKGPKNP